jgi:hypothetical protein
MHITYNSSSSLLLFLSPVCPFFFVFVELLLLSFSFLSSPDITVFKRLLLLPKYLQYGSLFFFLTDLISFYARRCPARCPSPLCPFSNYPLSMNTLSLHISVDSICAHVVLVLSNIYIYHQRKRYNVSVGYNFMQCVLFRLSGEPINLGLT